MKKLVSNSGLEIKARTMEARHTFTTKAARKMRLEFAQEALGHTSMATTQNYWAGFESKMKIEVAINRPQRRKGLPHEVKVNSSFRAKS
jgi:site-specific recombinase XerD